MLGSCFFPFVRPDGFVKREDWAVGKQVFGRVLMVLRKAGKVFVRIMGQFLNSELGDGLAVMPRQMKAVKKVLKRGILSLGCHEEPGLTKAFSLFLPCSAILWVLLVCRDFQ